MTVGSRRLAARCRERLATDPIAVTTFAESSGAEPQATEDLVGAETAAVPQDNVDATAT